MSIKALCLMSGGLDSALAAKLVLDQGIHVTGLAFTSLFFNAKNAQAIASQLSLPLIIKDISFSHLRIVKQPHFGYGKQMNPCLDCHLLMFKEAKKYLLSKNFNFLVTGEVLGQRSFSQTRFNLTLLEKKAGLEGLIVRPLSAKLLPPTIPDQKGWLKRDLLLGLFGKSRKTQLKLADKYHLTNFSAPGISCLLTDPHFSNRLKKLFKAYPNCQVNDINLLYLGRHFWLEKNKVLLIVGRNQRENELLTKLAQNGDYIIELTTNPGPTVLVRFYQKTTFTPVLAQAKKILVRFAPKVKNKPLAEKDFKVAGLEQRLRNPFR